MRPFEEKREQSRNDRLTAPSLINRKNIDSRRVTLSLMEEAARTGMISPERAEKIQFDLLKILKEQIARFTRGESSSVREETAQNLLQSVLYCTDSYLITIPEPEAAVRLLLEKGPETVFQRGRMMTALAFRQAKERYRQVRKNRISCGIQAYNDTLDGIAAFFPAYDLEFGAHNAPAEIDYPLSRDVGDGEGVRYINRYLQTLWLENDFCGRFDLKSLRGMLQNYGAACGDDYSRLLLNLFDLTAAGSLFSVLIGGSADDLCFSGSRARALRDTMERLGPLKVKPLLKEGLEKLITLKSIPSGEPTSFLEHWLDQFSDTVCAALQHGSFLSLVVQEQREEVSAPVWYRSGVKLEDEVLRALIDRLRACKTPEDKAAVVGEEVGSLEDLLELFGAGCIGEEELPAFFRMLSDHELAFIIGRYGQKRPGDAGNDFSYDNLFCTGDEAVWLSCFSAYFNSFDEPRKKEMILLSARIRQTE